MLEAIRAECFAEDVALPEAAVASTWTEDDARAFFESGGQIMPSKAVASPPAAAEAAEPTEPDEALLQLLQAASLDHLGHALCNERLASLWSLERTPLLSHLKSRGVDSLTHRQKLATAIAKARTEASATAATKEPVKAPPSPTAAASPATALSSAALPSAPPPPPPAAPPAAATPPPPTASPSATAGGALGVLLDSLSLGHLSGERPPFRPSLMTATMRPPSRYFGLTAVCLRLMATDCALSFATLAWPPSLAPPPPDRLSIVHTAHLGLTGNQQSAISNQLTGRPLVPLLIGSPD